MCDRATIGFQGRTPEAMEGSGGRARAALGALPALAALLLGCAPGHDASTGDIEADSLPASAIAATPAWHIDTLAAVSRLRPAGLSDLRTLWGIEGGRLARLHLDSGATTFQHPAWDVSVAADVVGWSNESGTWIWRSGSEPVRVAGAEPVGEFDGPPALLFAPDGHAAVLSWRAEWALHHELLGADGGRRTLDVRMPGYMAHEALLWLDSTRVLFSAIATGPVAGQPEYRESGWRGDLAVLDLQRGVFRRVTAVAVGNFLRSAGEHNGAVLVAEFQGSTVRGYWRYDPGSWERTPIALPAGRAFARGPLAIVLATVGTDRIEALLPAGDSLIRLGPVDEPGAEPAFSPDGTTAVIRIDGPDGARLIRIRSP